MLNKDSLDATLQSMGATLGARANADAGILLGSGTSYLDIDWAREECGMVSVESSSVMKGLLPAVTVDGIM